MMRSGAGRRRHRRTLVKPGPGSMSPVAGQGLPVGGDQRSEVRIRDLRRIERCKRLTVPPVGLGEAAVGTGGDPPEMKHA